MDKRYSRLLRLFSPITVLTLILAITGIAALPFLVARYLPFDIAATLQTPLYIVVGIVVLFLMLRGFLIYLEPMELELDPIETAPFTFDAPLKTISEQLTDLRDEIKNIGEVRINATDFDRGQIIDALKTSIDKGLTANIFKTIDEEFAKRDLKNKEWDRYITGFDEIKKRLYEETNNLARRANLNLALGSLTTVVAGIGLVIIVFYQPLDLAGLNKDEYSWKIIAHYIPRLSLIVFAELFAYFFLRLYKASLADIKYYQNEISNVELKLTALKAALAVKDNEILKLVIGELSKTERNFILKKDETTFDLERLKSDSINTKDLLEQLTALVKAKS